jgi:hypothetical protein
MTMNVAPQLTVVAPTELSTATEWAADCNIAIALIHAPDVSLPNFRDMFWHWISRRHGLKGYLEPQLTESTFPLLSVSFESPALRFVPLLPAGEEHLLDRARADALLSVEAESFPGADAAECAVSVVLKVEDVLSAWPQW